MVMRQKGEIYIEKKQKPLRKSDDCAPSQEWSFYFFDLDELPYIYKILIIKLIVTNNNIFKKNSLCEAKMTKQATVQWFPNTTWT